MTADEVARQVRELLRAHRDADALRVTTAALKTVVAPTLRLLRARALLRLDEPARALRDVEHARAEGAPSAEVDVLAAEALGRSARLVEARATLDRAIAAGAGSVEVWQVHQRLWKDRPLLWEKARPMRDLARLEPERAEVRLELARLSLRAGLYAAALPEAEAALAARQDDEARLLVASSAARSGQGERAREVLAGVGTRTVDVSRLWLELGDIERARDVAGEVAGSDAAVWRAELDLWTGDAMGAVQALGPDPLGAGARRVLAGVALMERRYEDVLDHSVAARDGSARDADARLLEATALRELGRRDEAKAAVHAARSASSEFHVAADLEQLLLEPRPQLERAVARHLAAVGAGSGNARDALLALSGNRSSMPTWVDAAGFRRWHVSPSPRFEASRLRGALTLLSFDEILARYDDLARTSPEPALVHSFATELLLWAGRYEEALARGRAALAGPEPARWGFVGVAAAELLLGRPDACLATLDDAEARIGLLPSSSVYRAEALLTLGRLDEAERVYRATVERFPSRWSAWLGLAATLDTARAEGAEAVIEALAPRAPVLFEDLRGGAGERARAALAAMRGNRSSGQITWEARGHWYGTMATPLAPTPAEPRSGR